MRVRACLAVAILLATAMVGGASQHAGAATNGPARALHCSAGPPFYFPYNYVYAFVGSGSGSTNGTSLYSCFSTATVTAIPAEDWKFKDWTGTCAGQGASCSVFVAHSYYEDGPIYQSWANFERLRATVTVQRSGNGTIRSDPGGIDCGNTCSAEFDQGSQVALDAIAPAGVQFNGWGGACANAQQNVRCVIGVPAGGATVTASFGPPPVH